MSFSTFISTTGNGLARATLNTQDNWTVEYPLTDLDVRCLAVDPFDSGVIYAGTQGQGLYRSRDRGVKWERIGLDGHIIKSVAISRSDPPTIYVGTKPPMIFMSTRDGSRWVELEAFREMRRWWWFTPAEAPLTQPYVMGLSVSPSSPQTIIAGIEYGAVLRTTDGGDSWTGHQKGALRDCHTLSFHPMNGDWVYEGGGGGAAFSDNAGHTWTQPDPQTFAEGIKLALGMGAGDSHEGGLDRHYGWAVAADPAQPRIWYCSVAPGPQQAHNHRGDARAHIYRSTPDGGWERLLGGLPDPLDYMPYALITDPAEPGHLYAGLSNGDIWHTVNHGDYWQQLPVNLGAIYTMVALP